MINSILNWLFKPSACKASFHVFIRETVIHEDGTYTHRLQCQNCPHHTDGWSFPRKDKLARFR